MKLLGRSLMVINRCFVMVALLSFTAIKIELILEDMTVKIRSLNY